MCRPRRNRLVGFCALPRNLFLEVGEVGICQDLLQSRYDFGVQRLEVGIRIPSNRVRRAQVVDSPSCFNFSNPRHRTRGKTRTRTTFCSEIQLPTAERWECWKRLQVQSLLLHKEFHKDLFLEIRVQKNAVFQKVVAKSC